jgi:hypothetical protein
MDGGAAVSVLWHVMFWLVLPVSLASCLVTYDNVRSGR